MSLWSDRIRWWFSSVWGREVVQKWRIDVLGSIAGVRGIRTTEHMSPGKRDGG